MPFSQENIFRISKGDQLAFSKFMKSTADGLILFATGFLHQKEIAEDIVSDVFVKIWENRHELCKIQNLKAYLYVSVKNACISEIRKAKKEKLISFDELEEYKMPSVKSTESLYINNETLNQIQQAIEQLPPKCKLAFSLAKFNGLKYKEIAEVMNISEKTVNNHLVYALKKLGEILKNENLF